MRSLVVTDLDGTLLRSDRSYDPRDLGTLHELGDRAVVRCIATGRNLFSAREAVPPSLPVDYVVFSSGAGVVDWPGGTLLERHLMSGGQTARAFEVLARRGLDFMVHEPVPENHRFSCYVADRGGDDFHRRVARYVGFAVRAERDAFRPREATQLLAIVARERGEAEYLAVRRELEGLSVVRSTSPLDHSSVWIEIFAPEVSKGQAVARLAARHSVVAADVLAVGNDYNDEDMLAWAGRGILVEGAPEPLRARFAAVGSNNAAGFSEAVSLWSSERSSS
jgi:HAD superfamily hydrolase (TIGR01484 family)